MNSNKTILKEIDTETVGYYEQPTSSFFVCLKALSYR